MPRRSLAKAGETGTLSFFFINPVFLSFLDSARHDKVGHFVRLNLPVNK